LNTLNLAGFDTATPRLINDFIAGNGLCPPPPPTPSMHPTKKSKTDREEDDDEFVILESGDE
jgi:hypothetical protein